MFKRIGIHLDRTNLASWMVKTGNLVQPLIICLQDYLQTKALVHLDETTLQVLDEPGKTALRLVEKIGSLQKANLVRQQVLIFTAL